MPPASPPGGLLLDIGGVVHVTGIHLVARLAEQLGALTNDMTDFHGAEWVARQEHLKLFDVIIDAGLLGILKPDPRAFGRAAGELGLAAEQIVFLDDMPANVEGARRAGLIAVRVPWDDPGPAIDTARELLGLPARRL